jgi:hypothetical protein
VLRDRTRACALQRKNFVIWGLARAHLELGEEIRRLVVRVGEREQRRAARVHQDVYERVKTRRVGGVRDGAGLIELHPAAREERVDRAPGGHAGVRREQPAIRARPRRRRRRRARPERAAAEEVAEDDADPVGDAVQAVGLVGAQRAPRRALELRAQLGRGDGRRGDERGRQRALERSARAGKRARAFGRTDARKREQQRDGLRAPAARALERRGHRVTRQRGSVEDGGERGGRGAEGGAQRRRLVLEHAERAAAEKGGQQRAREDVVGTARARAGCGRAYRGAHRADGLRGGGEKRGGGRPLRCGSIKHVRMPKAGPASRHAVAATGGPPGGAHCRGAPAPRPRARASAGRRARRRPSAGGAAAAAAGASRAAGGTEIPSARESRRLARCARGGFFSPT